MYLLIFLQLSQLGRWSWGYHVLLAKPASYNDNDSRRSFLEEGRYRDDPVGVLIPGLNDAEGENWEQDAEQSPNGSASDEDNYEPAGRTPGGSIPRIYAVDSEDDAEEDLAKQTSSPKHADGITDVNNINGHHQGQINDDFLSFPRIRLAEESPRGVRALSVRAGLSVRRIPLAISRCISRTPQRAFQSLPSPAQVFLTTLCKILTRIGAFLMRKDGS